MTAARDTAAAGGAVDASPMTNRQRIEAESGARIAAIFADLDASIARMQDTGRKLQANWERIIAARISPAEGAQP